MFGFGTQELLVILIIALFVFGGKKLPEIGAGLGKGLRSFRQGLSEMNEEIKENASAESDELNQEKPVAGVKADSSHKA